MPFTADLIYTDAPSSLEQGPLPYTQLFWEAFPAASGPTDRTTYMFSYMDAGACFSHYDCRSHITVTDACLTYMLLATLETHTPRPDPRRPSLEAMLDSYWQLLPQYQHVELSSLEIKRILFGLFPTFKASPLPATFDRLLQVGDASGIQSPLSFGGRHLRAWVYVICSSAGSANCAGSSSVTA